MDTTGSVEFLEDEIRGGLHISGHRTSSDASKQSRYRPRHLDLKPAIKKAGENPLVQATPIWLMLLPCSSLKNQRLVEVLLWTKNNVCLAVNVIGEVVDGPDDGMKRPALDGSEYDYVFDVEIGDGEPVRKLPYNRSDNPYDTADKWLLKENFPLSYREQVVAFILQNTGQKDFNLDPAFHDPYTGANAYVSGQSSSKSGPSKPNLKHIHKDGSDSSVDDNDFDSSTDDEVDNCSLLQPSSSVIHGGGQANRLSREASSCPSSSNSKVLDQFIGMEFSKKMVEKAIQEHDSTHPKAYGTALPSILPMLAPPVYVSSSLTFKTAFNLWMIIPSTLSPWLIPLIPLMNLFIKKILLLLLSHVLVRITLRMPNRIGFPIFLTSVPVFRLSTPSSNTTLTRRRPPSSSLLRPWLRHPSRLRFRCP